MKKAFFFPIIIAASILFSTSGICSPGSDQQSRRSVVEEEIWALEEGYFTNLYKANYDGVLALVHSRFLGWPGAMSQPIDKEESARFMRQLISKPITCAIRIERGGIRFSGEAALTQYTLHVSFTETGKTQSSRITHTWIKESGRWKLLGGMSYDK